MAGPEKHTILVLPSVQTPNQGRKGEEPWDSAFLLFQCIVGGHPAFPTLHVEMLSVWSMGLFSSLASVTLLTHQSHGIDCLPAAIFMYVSPAAFFPWTPDLRIQFSPCHLPYAYPHRHLYRFKSESVVPSLVFPHCMSLSGNPVIPLPKFP